MLKQKKSTLPKIVALDVFCGAAGLSYGLKSAGIDIAAGIDVDPDCRYAFEHNIKAPLLLADVSSLQPLDLAGLYPQKVVRMLAGCAPCQPFSRYNAKRPSLDERWRLLFKFLQFVQDLRPEIVTVENVPDLARLPLWAQFTEELEKGGYYAAWDIVDASRYGVPQSRRRLVLVASLLGPIRMPTVMSGPASTVRSAIGRLPEIRAGDRSKTDLLHRARGLTPCNLARIRASRPAGTWREWPSEMRVSCHVNGESRYPSVYGRMSWDKPSPTITTQFYGFGNGRFGHPEQDRALTLREGALLQSFPKDFEFVEKGTRFSFNTVGKLIGNAVPPALAEAIGRTVVSHVNEYHR